MKKAGSSPKRLVWSSILSAMLIVTFAFLAVNNAMVGEIFYPGQCIDADQETRPAVCQAKQQHKYQDGYKYAIALCDFEAYILYMEQSFSIYPPEWTCPVFIVLPDMVGKVLD
ncbi:MAG TPA: hypothetical protein PKD41_00125 [Solidesulfovibrio sp.]|nr:hypothetical protein [Solidesulfovibrio sp.]